MMKLSIQEAINQAKQDPNSDFANKVRQMIESGQLDEAAQKQGFDLSKYGRPGLKKKVGVETLEDFKRIGEETLEQVEEGAKIQQEAKEAFDRGDISAGERVLQQLGGAAKSGVGAIGAAFKGGVKMLLPQRAEEKLKEKAAEVGQDFVQTVQDPENTAPGAVMVRNLIADYNKLKEEDPEAAKNVDAAINIGSLAAEFIGVGAMKRVTQPARQVVGQIIDEGATRAGKYVDNVLTKVDDAQDAISAGTHRMADTPEARTELVGGIENAYNKAFVDDRVSINNKLNKLAAAQRTTKEQLVKDLAEEGIVPAVNGKMADMNPAIETLSGRISNLGQGLDEMLAPFDQLRTLDDVQEQALRAIRTDKRFPGGQIDQGESFVTKTIENYRKRYGDSLNARQMNELRIELNQQFKEGAEIDAAEVLGNIMRQNIDDIAPIATEVNQELGRLIVLRKTASLFNNTPIDVGVLGGQLGRMLGALGAGVGGASVAGPGGLVVSGIAAHYGGNVIAQFLRSRRFSKEARDLLEDALRKDQNLLKQLQDTADAEARKYLEKFALPAPEVDAPAKQINVPPKLPTRSLPNEPQAQQIIDVDGR